MKRIIGLGLAVVLTALGLGAPQEASASAPKLDLAHVMVGVQAPHANPVNASLRSKTFTGTVYSGAKQTITTTGFGLSAMTVDLPTLDITNDFHSLAELALSNGNNTVEVGWDVDPLVCGALSPPCLWAGMWKNGVFQGYNTNAVPVAGCTPCLNTSLSGAIGTTKQFGIQYVTNANPALNAWFVSYNNSFQAGFLASNWTSPTFTGGTLNQAFGELASGATPYTDSCSNIGSNVQPTGSPSFLGAKLNGWSNVGGAAVSLTAIQTDAKWPVFLTPSGAAARFGGLGKVTSPCPAT